MGRWPAVCCESWFEGVGERAGEVCVGGCVPFLLVQ